MTVTYETELIGRGKTQAIEAPSRPGLWTVQRHRSRHPYHAPPRTQRSSGTRAYPHDGFQSFRGDILRSMPGDLELLPGPPTDPDFMPAAPLVEIAIILPKHLLHFVRSHSLPPPGSIYCSTYSHVCKGSRPGISACIALNF